MRNVILEGLADLAGRLERGELDGRFDMSVWWIDMSVCGCIGGHLGAYLSDHADGPVTEAEDEELGELFFMRDVASKRGVSQEDLHDRVNPKMAAKAIRNFLDHGDPRWEEVLS